MKHDGKQTYEVYANMCAIQGYNSIHEDIFRTRFLILALIMFIKFRLKYPMVTMLTTNYCAKCVDCHRGCKVDEE